MYKYQADAAKDVPAKVTANAGRAQGGDFKWTFNNAVDDASYAVNKELKAALVNYKSSIVAIGSGSYVAPKDEPAVTTSATQPSVTTSSSAVTTAEQTTSATAVASDPVNFFGYIHNFTEQGTDSNFYRFRGNLSTSKGTVTYDYKTLTTCFKMESASTIEFCPHETGYLTLVFGEQTASIKLDGQKYSTTNGTIILPLDRIGEHALTKADSCNLFYMEFTPSNVEITTSADESETTSAQTTETTAVSETAAETGSTVEETTASETTAPAVSTLAGDVNCDGKQTISDAILLARIVAEDSTVKVTENGLANAELDGVSGLSTEDTTILLKMLAGLM